MADYPSGVPIKITDVFRVGGTETDPTAIVYTILGPDGVETEYNWPGDPEVTHVGTGSFSLNIGAPGTPGLYTYDVTASGAVVASRSGAFNVLADVNSAAVPWAVQGPCSPWVSSQDVWNCCGQPVTTVDGDECPVDFTAHAYSASEILFGLSGRIFSGQCSKTVRPPCRATCGCSQVLSRGHIVGGEDFWGVREGPCDPSRVLLSGYPVREITEVLIDGVALAESEYELRDWRWLVRKNNSRWPGCQDLSLDDTEEGTWSVSYRYGQDPPLSGQDAATELACELYRACIGDGECALPTGTTRVVRQGVVIDRLAFTAWGLQDGSWRTGLQKVDAFLNTFAPNRITRRPTFWSPASHMQYARRAGV